MYALFPLLFILAGVVAVTGVGVVFRAPRPRLLSLGMLAFLGLALLNGYVFMPVLGRSFFEVAMVGLGVLYVLAALSMVLVAHRVPRGGAERVPRFRFYWPLALPLAALDVALALVTLRLPVA